MAAAAVSSARLVEGRVSFLFATGGHHNGDMHEDRPQQHEQAHQERRTMAIRLVVGLVLLALFLLFIASNSHTVLVSFVFVDTRVQLIWVFLACALIGALVAYLLGRTGRRNTKRYIRELERRVGEHE